MFVVEVRLSRARGRARAPGEVFLGPRPFWGEGKDGDPGVRVAKLSGTSGPGKGAGRLMLLVGEVKQIEPARYGHKLVIKHLPDML